MQCRSCGSEDVVLISKDNDMYPSDIDVYRCQACFTAWGTHKNFPYDGNGDELDVIAVDAADPPECSDGEHCECCEEDPVPDPDESNEDLDLRGGK
jgi:hypothetical protein